MLTARDKEGNRIPVVNNDGTTNMTGFCPCCMKPLVAKVGHGERCPHWAHRHAERCDEWWESETNWHLKWRKWFIDANGTIPIDVENVLEKDGESHFYDIRFAENLSFILRRARLSMDQLQLRERFFGNMAWIIEAKKTDFSRLVKQLYDSDLKELELKNCYWCLSADESFFAHWQDCTMPVVFDFLEASKEREKDGANDSLGEDLWVVLPKNEMREYFVVRLKRMDFHNRLLGSGKIFKKTYSEVSEILRKKNYLREDVTMRHASPPPSKMLQEKIYIPENNLPSHLTTANASIYGNNQALANYWCNREHQSKDGEDENAICSDRSGDDNGVRERAEDG